MKGAILDHDILNRVLNAIGYIKMFKLAVEHGADVSLDNSNIMDEDGCLEMVTETLYTNPKLFNVDTVDVYVNDPEWEGKVHFEEICEWFLWEEVSVTGLLFQDEMLYRFYEICKENNVDINKTDFSQSIIYANSCIPQYGDGYTYMEIFIPDDTLIEKYRAPIFLFFTDSTLLNYSMLSNYYDAYDFAKRVVNGEVNLILEERK